MFVFELILYCLFGMALNELKNVEMWPYAICVVCFIANGVIGYLEGVSQRNNEEEKE